MVRISIALLVASVRLGTCCECVLLPAKAEAKHSEVVFSGKITEISDSQITFAVERVFKGRIPAVFRMVNFTMGSGCSPGFARHLVKTGNQLLVYAWRTEFFHEGSLTSTCSRTGLVQNASADLKQLGRGRPTQCIIRGDPLHNDR
jgi:hypothetical protein